MKIGLSAKRTIHIVNEHNVKYAILHLLTHDIFLHLGLEKNTHKTHKISIESMPRNYMKQLFKPIIALNNNGAQPVALTP